MKRGFLFGAIFAIFIAVPAFAGDIPSGYKKCKLCHGIPGSGGKIGPDLTKSRMTLEQYQMQVAKGSKWPGRPPRVAGYEKKKMTKQRATPAQVKAIYYWVETFKK